MTYAQKKKDELRVTNIKTKRWDREDMTPSRGKL
jgi:hypothetical protein